MMDNTLSIKKHQKLIELETLLKAFDITNKQQRQQKEKIEFEIEQIEIKIREYWQRIINEQSKQLKQITKIHKKIENYPKTKEQYEALRKIYYDILSLMKRNVKLKKEYREMMKNKGRTKC